MSFAPQHLLPRLNPSICLLHSWIYHEALWLLQGGLGLYILYVHYKQLPPIGMLSNSELASIFSHQFPLQ